MVSSVNRLKLEVIIRVNTTSILLFSIEMVLTLTCIRILFLLALNIQHLIATNLDVNLLVV